MKQFQHRLTPFILVGIAAVVLAFGILLFTYLFLLGTLAGLVLFTIAWIRDKFSTKPNRIIEGKNWEKLNK